MTAIHENWTVLPHGPLTFVDEGILTVTGQIQMPFVELQRRMTVVRLRDGSSVIYSAIALEDCAMKRIEALGQPRYLIVPSDAHRLDAKIFKQRYPALLVLAPEGARNRVEEVVPVDDSIIDFDDPDVSMQTIAGTGAHEAALLVRRASGTTLILNDIMSNLRRKGGLEGWLLHVMGFGSDEPEIPTVTKMMVIRSKAEVRHQLTYWADNLNLKRILVSHGDVLETNPAATLHDLANSLG
jgi:hypothetical protein